MLQDVYDKSKLISKCKNDCGLTVCNTSNRWHQDGVKGTSSAHVKQKERRSITYSMLIKGFSGHLILKSHELDVLYTKPVSVWVYGCISFLCYYSNSVIASSFKNSLPKLDSGSKNKRV